MVICDGRYLAREMLTVAGAAKDLLFRKKCTLFPLLPHHEVKPITLMVKDMSYESQYELNSFT